MFGSKEQQIEISGGKMPCITFGSGSRPLVMIPGLRTASIEGTGSYAAAYYRIFSKEFTVYMLDRKDNVPDSCTIRDMADDTAEAMRTLGIENACVFGASLGGMIAQELAINYPGLVNKLVLAVTASRINDTITDSINTWIRLIGAGDIDGFAIDYAYRGYSDNTLKRYKAFLPMAMKVQKMMPPERFIRLARACLTVDTYDRLGEIKCPVFVIGGGKDKALTGEASREIAEKTGAECYMYEELSHEAYSEAKDFNKRVLEFLLRE